VTGLERYLRLRRSDECPNRAPSPQTVHHLDTMLFIEQGNCVAAEGTTEGTDVHGVEWHGGRTRGGRFCSIFLFGQSGLIERLRIYMDPDCTGGHKEGFLWPKRSVDSW
jgi:hypothetical protein